MYVILFDDLCGHRHYLGQYGGGMTDPNDREVAKFDTAAQARAMIDGLDDYQRRHSTPVVRTALDRS